VDINQRQLLEAFDGDKRAGAHVSLNLGAAGDANELFPVAEEMVTIGWLRRGDSGFYVRTEKGRLALAGPLDVTLYTRPGCHLCDQAKVQIAPLLRKVGAHLIEVNIDADDGLRALYNVDVPVLLLGQRKVAKHRVDLKQLERQLAEAARNANSDKA
jgi:hypothetical protein